MRGWRRNGWVAALLLIAAAASADMISMVDKADIDEMQTIRLTVRITGTDQIEGLDLAPVEQDFDMVDNPRTQSQFRSINGRVSSWAEYNVTLRPKRTGVLTIPSLSYRGEQSEALTIRVRPVAQSVKDEIEQLVFFEVTLDKETVYVQAQAVLTRRLYYTSGVQIYGDLPGAPELGDAVVLPLGEAVSGATMRGSQRYGVLEQRYAIFPEASGSFEIPGFSITTSVRLPGRGRRGVRVHAPTKTLTVLGVPDSYPASAPWFPAKRVDLSERWTPDQARLRAGDALQRTVIIQANGAIGSGIPPIHAPLPETHFKQYPSPPGLKEDTAGQSVIGEREQVYELITTHGGRITTPEIVVPWWDTENLETRYARLPPRNLSIAGEPPQRPDAAPPETPSTKPIAVPEPLLTEPAESPTWLWFSLAGLALAGLCAFVAVKYQPRRNAYRSARQALRNASGVYETQQVLNRYAAHVFAVSPAQASAAIRKHTAEGAELLDRMNRTAYAIGSGNDQDFRPAALALLESIKAAAQPNAHADDLPPLYS